MSHLQRCVSSRNVLPLASTGVCQLCTFGVTGLPKPTTRNGRRVDVRRLPGTRPRLPWRPGLACLLLLRETCWRRAVPRGTRHRRGEPGLVQWQLGRLWQPRRVGEPDDRQGHRHRSPGDSGGVRELHHRYGGGAGDVAAGACGDRVVWRCDTSRERCRTPPSTLLCALLAFFSRMFVGVAWRGVAL